MYILFFIWRFQFAHPQTKDFKVSAVTTGCSGFIMCSWFSRCIFAGIYVSDMCSAFLLCTLCKRVCELFTKIICVDFTVLAHVEKILPSATAESSEFRVMCLCASIQCSTVCIQCVQCVCRVQCVWRAPVWCLYAVCGVVCALCSYDIVWIYFCSMCLCLCFCCVYCVVIICAVCVCGPAVILY